MNATSVTARLEPGKEPLEGAFRLRRSVDPLIIQQQLPVSVKSRSKGSGARDPGIEITVFPRWRMIGVDVGIGHADPVFVFNPLGIKGVHFHRLRRFERIGPGPGPPPFSVRHPLYPVRVPVGVHRSEIAVIRINPLQPSEIVLGPDIPLQDLVPSLLRCGVQLKKAGNRMSFRINEGTFLWISHHCFHWMEVSSIR